MATDDPFQAVLDKITHHEAEAVRWKLWINQGDEAAGRPPRFADVSAPMSGASPTARGYKRWKEGAFFNKPLAAAVRTILEARYEASGNEADPASVDFIHEALTQGSFGFEVTGADTQKNSIRISLGKNSTTFVKLPGTDVFGLVEWYGRPTRRPRTRLSELAVTEDATDEEPANENPAPVAAADDDVIPVAPMRR